MMTQAVLTFLFSNTAIEMRKFCCIQQSNLSNATPPRCIHHILLKLRSFHLDFECQVKRSVPVIVHSKYKVTLINQDNYIAVLKCLRAQSDDNDTNGQTVLGSKFQK